MTRKLAILAACVLLAVTVHSVDAQRICNPFTTSPDAGMLGLGTSVRFQHFEANGIFERVGTITAFYIRSCFPGAYGIMGLDDQAYIVDYGSPDGSSIILNLRQITVIQ